MSLDYQVKRESFSSDFTLSPASHHLTRWYKRRKSLLKVQFCAASIPGRSSFLHLFLFSFRLPRFPSRLHSPHLLFCLHHPPSLPPTTRWQGGLQTNWVLPANCLKAQKMLLSRRLQTALPLPKPTLQFWPTRAKNFMGSFTPSLRVRSSP